MNDKIVPYSDSNRHPQQFDFNGKPVRTLLDEHGDPIFIAADVCKVLDLEQVSRAVARLDDDQKGVTTVTTPGGPQQMATVNESGLYALIFTSRKPEAKAFRKWVTSEVLPAIRKTGGYSLQNMTPAEIGLYHAQRLVAHERELARLAAEAEQHEDRITELEAHIQRPTREYTVMGYAIKHRIRVGIDEAKSIGIRAAKLSRDRGINIGKTSDPRFGEVNTYDVSILDELLGGAK